MQSMKGMSRLLVPRMPAALVRMRSSANPSIRSDEVPRIAIFLGGAGLIPFFWYGAQHQRFSENAVPWGDATLDKWSKLTGANLDWLKSKDQGTIRTRYLTYAASILSFLGAVHWGAAMVAPGPLSRVQYTWSVLPSLLGWTALNVERDPETGVQKGTMPHLILSFGFLAAYFFDEFAAQGGRSANTRHAAVPAFYTFIRTPLTTAVVATTAVAGYIGKEKDATDHR